MKLQFTAIALAALTLVGCATPTFTQEQLRAKTQEGAAAAIDSFKKQSNAQVREVNEPYVDFKRTAAPRIRGDVSLTASSTPFAPVLSELGKRGGYSVAYAEGVDANRKVTVSFNGAFLEDAIRTTAFLAGYVAVIDKQQRTVMVSDVATYTFKLPSTVFTALNAQYSVGGNPASSASTSGGSSSGSTQSGGQGGSSLKAEFTIAGKDSASSSGLSKFLTEMAGKNAEVIVSDSGHISIRANAQSLRRVHDFLKGFARDAMTQVEMEASVVEVSLTKDFALGIQWSQVVNAASSGAMVGGSAALATALGGGGTAALITDAVSQSTNGLSAFKVDASSASLIKALSQFTEVNIVSQPKLLSLNNVPATFFDGTQIPYLGSLTQTPATTTGGTPTTTGSVAFAVDGVSFSAIPSVVDSSTVQITLMPVLSSVSGMQSFLNGQLQVPAQGSRQTYMRVLAESNKTLILGGIRYNKDSKQTNVPSSVSSSTSSKEVVILLRTKVIPAINFDPIVNESL